MTAVIQARSGSTRLPGKVLRDLGGRPVLGWVIRAASASVQVDQVVVATTVLPEDDEVSRVAAAAGAEVVRGPVDDVLARFLLAVDTYPTDAVVRLTADCPVLDPALIDAVVAVWRAAPDAADYVSTALVRTLPRGLDVELVTVDALRQVSAVATAHHRTHVTSGIWTAPEGYRLLGLVTSPPAADLRVTLDTVEDARLLEGLVAGLGSEVPAWRDVVAALRADPGLAATNAAVVQKQLAEG